MMMKKVAALAAIATTLTACGHPMTPCVATKATPAYAEVNGYPGQPAFTIPAGSICDLGETVYGKVDAYTEVKCKAGHGWVLDKENFRAVK